jgi:hypothetical protein
VWIHTALPAIADAEELETMERLSDDFLERTIRRWTTYALICSLYSPASQIDSVLGSQPQQMVVRLAESEPGRNECPRGTEPQFSGILDEHLPQA